MTEEKVKTPDELADEEVNKQIAKALACRKLEIKKCKARIKKLEKEIKKIIDGELIPDEEDCCSPSDSNKNKGWQPPFIVNIPKDNPKKEKKYHDYADWTCEPHRYYWYDNGTTTGVTTHTNDWSTCVSTGTVRWKSK